MDKSLEPKKAKVIEAILAPIVGEPLTDMWKAGGQYFEFGKQLPFTNRCGRAATRSALRLKAVAPGGSWIVTRSSELVVGSDDCVLRRRFFDRKTPPRDPARRHRWRVAHDFFKRVSKGDLQVLSLKAEDTGSLRIELEDGYALSIFSTSATALEFWYFWNDGGFGITMLNEGMEVVDKSARRAAAKSQKTTHT